MIKFKLLLSALLIGFSQLASAGPLFDAAIANITASSDTAAVQAAIDAAAVEGMDLGEVVVALQSRSVQNVTIAAAITNNINSTSASRYTASNPAVQTVLATLGGVPTAAGGTGGAPVLSFTGAGTGGATAGAGGATGGVSPQ